MTTKDNIKNNHQSRSSLFGERHTRERCFPPQADCCELTMRCRRCDYSASLVARAVEDCDAHLINLNVTSLCDPSAADHLFVDLRISLRNADSVVRSLSRYGYDVVDIAGEEYSGTPLLDPAMRDRLDLLIHNLEI